MERGLRRWFIRHLPQCARQSQLHSCDQWWHWLHVCQRCLYWWRWYWRLCNGCCFWGIGYFRHHQQSRQWIHIKPNNFIHGTVFRKWRASHCQTFGWFSRRARDHIQRHHRRSWNQLHLLCQNSFWFRFKRNQRQRYGLSQACNSCSTISQHWQLHGRHTCELVSCDGRHWLQHLS